MGASASVVCDSDEFVVSADGFQKLGVKLSFCEKFIEECGGQDSLKGLTTTDVCDKYVRPNTIKEKDSYCNVLKVRCHPAVAKATVFISHAWKFLFLDVVEALKYHFKDQPDIVIWFDLFSNNQHDTTSKPFEWWCNTFKSAIGDFGHVVMVLTPWSNPVPLTRAWCLFELYCIADTPNGKFEVAMCKTEQSSFLDDICRDPSGEIDKMLAVVDCAKSESYNPIDRDLIFKVVNEVVGFANINKMVFEQLRNWMVEVTNISQENETDDDKKLSLQFALADVYQSQGLYDKAEPLYVSCLEKRKIVLGDNHPDTLASFNEQLGYFVQKSR